MMKSHLKQRLIMKKIFSNLLLQYTIISLLITILIASVMSIMTINITENLILKMHSNFYSNYVASIKTNYNELLSIFSEEKENLNLHPAEHFSEDLLMIPTIRNISIYSLEGKVLWQVFPESNAFSGDRQLLRDAISRDFSYSLDYSGKYNRLNIFLPVMGDSKAVGVIKIEEDLEQTHLSLQKSRQIITLIIVTGGAAFYILLFYLFLRSYLSHSAAFKKLESSQRITIHSMSLLSELRDNETGAHILRTSAYCRILAERLSRENQFRKYLTPEYIDDFVQSAPLHDIGKVGVPDNILLKPGKLTEEEFTVIRKHPVMGAEVLKKASSTVEIQTFFKIGIQVVLHHHENWNGSGYPDGLSGELIPLSARIMALADVYDALRTERPYKKAFSHQRAINIIKDDAGKKFDPEIVRAFLDSEKEFLEISNEIID
ncbi:MAG: HD domain-containing protein [Spirochaetales bacterium]|nr:HD domain-containing protein [Spirochaetales bacterium]